MNTWSKGLVNIKNNIFNLKPKIKKIYRLIVPQKIRNVIWLFRKHCKRLIREATEFKGIRKNYYFNTNISLSEVPIDKRRCTIFASYSYDGTIPDYTVYFLKELKKISQFIVFVADNDLKNESELHKIDTLVNVAFFGRHRGYDFNSQKKGYNYILEKDFAKDFHDFLFVNDSCYGPMYDLSSVYEKMKPKNVDFWGLCDSTDDVYHLQSFFINCNSKVFFSKELNSFFSSLPKKMDFQTAVDKGEKPFTKMLSKSFTSGCFLPRFATGNTKSYIGGNRNPTVWPVSLLKSGFPLIKVKALIGVYEKQLNESFSDTMLYIYKNNKPLYEIIINDLKRRFGNVPKEYYFSKNGEDLTFVLNENISVVSFDIFDTLLIRPFTNPTDLFLLIEKDQNLDGFYIERINAEKRAREISKFQEITIDEIYENINPKFSHVKEIELDYEKRLLRRNPAIEKIYAQVCNTNKKIIAISDMYLGKDFLREVLIKNRFENISEIFVSSDCRKTKNSRDIYKFAISNTPPKFHTQQLLHIGDNEESDERIPLSMGINAFQIDKVIDRFIIPGNAKWVNWYYANKSLGKSIHFSLIAKHLFYEKEFNIPYWEMMGYRLGLGIVSYLNYVLKGCQKNNIDRLFFVARDGWILKELYEKFFMKLYGIPCSYVYLTRIIGLKATLDFNEEPVYLKKLLKEASKEIKGLNVHDDYKSNLKEFKIHEDSIKSWSAPKKTEFEKHLKLQAKDSKNIAVVDTTTGNFSSLRFAKSVLGSRIKTAFFTGTSFEKPEYAYATFSNRLLSIEDKWHVMLMEEIFSSPFPSAISLENGNPVFDQEEDSSRSNLFLQLAKGIEDYVRDLIDLFGTNINSICITFEDFLDMLKWYKRNINPIDLEELSHIKHKDLMRDEEYDLSLSAK